MSTHKTYILKFSCVDRMGIVASVAGFLVEQGFNTLESAQFDDETTGHFFMRTVFAAGDYSPGIDDLKAAFKAIANRFEMNWEIHDVLDRPKVLLMVSKFGHCLNDLLYRHSIGAIPFDIPAIVSNHPDLQHLANAHGIAFHHMPVTPDMKMKQEGKLKALIEETQTDLVVLARYMQILSADLCDHLEGRAINIHHSFLPSFKGAKPYHQAHERGVKLIGATAHYVTPDLDEGPIIEQETARVTHAQTPEQLIAIGRDLENLVLARAIKLHCEQRVLLNGHKTVVFP